MPNWVFNEIEFTGEEKNIRTVFELITTAEDGKVRLDFNKIVPQPESLDMVSGSLTDEAIIAFLTKNATDESGLKEAKAFGIRNGYSPNWEKTLLERVKKHIEEDGIDKQYNFGSSLGEEKMFTLYDAGRIYVENFLRYGATNWYNWSCNNWGTKWNACNSYVGEHSIQFDTAWSAPIPIIEKLADICKKFNVWFEGKFADENIGCNCGVYNSEATDVVEYYEDDSEEAVQLARDLWGYDPDEEE